MRLIVLTGASGSGKTAIAEAFQAKYSDCADVLFFDSIGIPSSDQMIAEFGAVEAWQRAKTMEWMSAIAARASSQRCILFEGQMRLSFLTEALAATKISDYRIVLVDCDDATRTQRLVADRAQPDLANPTMLTWAKFLREEAQRANCEILDTTAATIEVCVETIAKHLP